MDSREKLDRRLHSQIFADHSEKDGISENMERYKAIAAGYSQTENAIAVLSDMKMNVSYIFYGGMAEIMGIGESGASNTIDSIWEEEIFRSVVPEDMDKKHIEELKFFHFLKTLPQIQRSSHYLDTSLRMMGGNGRIYNVRHRIFYIGSEPNGSIRLALCLYNIINGDTYDGYIYNSADGTSAPLDSHDCANIISSREKDVLRLIETGMSSKEIADKLSISVYTVNRHRQNILAKLKAVNSVEACRIAKQLKLL